MAEKMDIDRLLEDHGLDADIWSPLLKEFGVTKPNQLMFQRKETIAALKGKKKHDWEANALDELFKGAHSMMAKQSEFEQLLEESGLDPDIWGLHFKDLGVTKSIQLKFQKTDALTALKEKKKHDWEADALDALFKIYQTDKVKEERHYAKEPQRKVPNELMEELAKKMEKKDNQRKEEEKRVNRQVVKPYQPNSVHANESESDSEEVMGDFQMTNIDDSEIGPTEASTAPLKEESNRVVETRAKKLINFFNTMSGENQSRDSVEDHDRRQSRSSDVFTDRDMRQSRSSDVFTDRDMRQSRSSDLYTDRDMRQPRSSDVSTDKDRQQSRSSGFYADKDRRQSKSSDIYSDKNQQQWQSSEINDDNGQSQLRISDAYSDSQSQTEDVYSYINQNKFHTLDVYTETDKRQFNASHVEHVHSQIKPSQMYARNAHCQSKAVYRHDEANPSYKAQSRVLTKIETPIETSKPHNAKNENFGAVLEYLNLSRYLKKKILLNDILKIYDNEKEQNVAFKILRGLLLRNRDARDDMVQTYNEENTKWLSTTKQRGFKRNETSQIEQKNPDLNSMDVLVAIFHCCSSQLRQVLCEKLFLCQLAYPILLPRISSPEIEACLWPLRKIYINTDKGQVSLPSADIEIVTFVQLGQTLVSKSDLMNHILGVPNAFFGSNSPTGHIDETVTAGLTECCVFQTANERTEKKKLERTTALFNLRGDGQYLHRELALVTELSDVIVVFINPLEKVKASMIIALKIMAQKRLICLIQNQRSLKDKDLNKFMDKIRHKTEDALDEVTSFYLSEHGKENNIQMLSQKLIGEINENSARKHGKSIESKMFSMTNDIVQLDEKEDLCALGFQHAEEIFEMISKLPIQTCKEEILPLQSTLWKKWSEKFKQGEGNRLEIGEKGRVKEQMLMIEKKMKEVESHNVFAQFVQSLQTSYNQSSGEYFLRWLKLLLDEKSMKDLKVVRKHWLDTKLHYEAVKREVVEAGNYSIESKGKKRRNDQELGLEALQKEVLAKEQIYIDASLGLEHFLREVGLAYQFQSKTTNIGMIIKNLPNVAASLLLQGIPLEVMDGDASNIPKEWVRQVFTEIHKQLGNVKVFVLSVLGIQSSGKSTLLNTMFGIDFAVSAGRCTRGLFMQLIPVDKSKSSLSIDYLIVLDTEGLKSQEIGNMMHNHDNMLATLVIGVANATIINIKGENQAEMKDILEIVVHAFLKIQVANNKLLSVKRCIFAHQNVSAHDAESQLAHAQAKFIDELNAITKAAAEKEGIEGIVQFNQIIKFEGTTDYDRWYFSDCWKGDPPMAPFNSTYSEKALQARQSILKSIENSRNSSDIVTLPQVLSCLNDMWMGVLSLDFVFSFKNSLEIAASRLLEDTYNEILNSVEDQISEFLAILSNQIKAENSIEALELTLRKCTKELSEKLAPPVRADAWGKISHFFDSNEKRSYTEQWRNQKERQFEGHCTKLVEEAINSLTQVADVASALCYAGKRAKSHREKIKYEALNIAEKYKNMNLSDNDLDKEFEVFWARNTSDLPVEKVKTVNVREHFMHELEKEFRSDRHLLYKELGHFKDYSKKRNLMLERKMIKDEHVRKKMIVTDANRKSKWFLDITRFFARTRIEDYNTYLLDEANMRLKKIEQKIQNIVNTSEVYKSKLVKDSLDIIAEQYRTFGNLRFEEFPLNLTPAFKVLFYVHAGMYAVQKLQLMYDSFMQERSLKATIEKDKIKMRQIFKNTANNAVKEKISADFLCTSLSARLVETVEQEIQESLKQETVRDFGRNKFHLISRILESLQKYDNFEDYIQYVRDPEVYSQEWLERWFQDKVEEQYLILLESTMKIKIKKLKDCLRETCKKFQNVSSKFIEAFCDSIRTVVPLPYREVQDAANWDTENIDYFEMLVLESLEENRKDQEIAIIHNKGKWKGTPPHQAAFDILWGCSEKCPLCGEPCQISDPDHYKHGTCHRTIEHKPQGIRGIRVIDTQALVPEPCCYDITTERVYIDGNDERKPYKQYKKYWPEWHIDPSPSVDSCKYWMRLMWQHRESLTTYYTGTNASKIPQVWGEISEKEAIESLYIYKE